MLVVRGASYIGSYMLKIPAKVGHEVFALDNISTSSYEAMKYGRLVVGDLQI